MAEALARHFHGEQLLPASAGISPLGHVAPETVSVLLEIGVLTLNLYSKGLTAVALPSYDLIINLARHDLHRHLPPPLHSRVVTRPVHDPYGGSLEIYRKVRDDIRRLLAAEIPGWLRRG